MQHGIVGRLSREPVSEPSIMKRNADPRIVLLVSGALAFVSPTGETYAQTPTGCFSTATNFECGINAVANNSGGTALGHTARASAGQSSAFGSQSQASGSGAVAVGYRAAASFSSSTAVGDNSQSHAMGATAIGSFALAFTGADFAVAIGANSVATDANTGILRRRLIHATARQCLERGE